MRAPFSSAIPNFSMRSTIGSLSATIIKKAGNAKRKSVNRPRIPSTRPRKYPPTIPTKKPIVSAVAVARNAIIKEILEP